MKRSFFRAVLVCLFGAGLPGGSLVVQHVIPSQFAYPVTSDPAEPLEPKAKAVGLAWPPARLRLLALKQERVLEVWAADADGPFRRLTTYAILAASGVAGPKRREGDLQVPEGIYRLTTLNPQSRYHLSVRLDYPNATDLANSKLPRSEMGGDIYLHGKDVSIGCLAIGDEAIERLYDLIGRIPKGNRWIVLAPTDFRRFPNFRLSGAEPWVDRLYETIEGELQELPLDGNGE